MACFYLIFAGQNPPYVFLEDVIEKKFNNIYFAARTTCSGMYVCVDDAQFCLLSCLS